MGFLGGLAVKNPPAKAGEAGFIPGSGRFPGGENGNLISGSGRYPGGGNGNPLQYSYLGNPMDRGAWWAIIQGIAKESGNT